MLSNLRTACMSQRLRMSQIVTRNLSSSESQFMILNSVGEDRPGIVSDMTKIVLDHNGNVGESQASKLGTHFGLMMLVSVPKDQSELLQNAVKSMSGMKTTCYLTENPDTVQVQPESTGYAGHFSLAGTDDVGLVHEVTKVLAKHRLSIQEMKTYEDKSIPYGGLSLFYISGIATSPNPLANGFDPEAIRDELEDLGDRMNCEITIQDIEDDDDDDDDE